MLLTFLDEDSQVVSDDARRWYQVAPFEDAFIHESIVPTQSELDRTVSRSEGRSWRLIVDSFGYKEDSLSRYEPAPEEEPTTHTINLTQDQVDTLFDLLNGYVGVDVYNYLNAEEWLQPIANLLRPSRITTSETDFPHLRTDAR